MRAAIAQVFRDCYGKAGLNEKACDTYAVAASLYLVAPSRPLKAVAVLKRILRLQPGRAATGTRSCCWGSRWTARSAGSSS